MMPPDGGQDMSFHKVNKREVPMLRIVGMNERRESPGLSRSRIETPYNPTPQSLIRHPKIVRRFGHRVSWPKTNVIGIAEIVLDHGDECPWEHYPAVL
jgi:hypothetical protein